MHHLFIEARYIKIYFMKDEKYISKTQDKDKYHLLKKNFGYFININPKMRTFKIIND